MLVTESEEYYRRLNLFSKVNRLAVIFHNAIPKLQTMGAIDLENEEVLLFLKDLELNNIKYLLVGGFAVAFHGLVRATHDLDIWVRNDEHNLLELKNILIQHGVEGLKASRNFDLIPGYTQFALGSSGFVVDPMKALKAFSSFDFDKCYEAAATGEYKGVKFKVMSREDLLKEKETNNRPKDQGDIEYLRSMDKAT